MTKMHPKGNDPDFILDKVTLGTTLKLTYRIMNDRTLDYKKFQLTERENWQGSFAKIIHNISKKMAEECTFDLDNQKIRDIRAKNIAFEGLKAKAVLQVHLVSELDPFEVKTHEITLTGEQKKTVIDEAKAYIEERSRVQGELFDMREAVVKVNDQYREGNFNAEKKAS